MDNKFHVLSQLYLPDRYESLQDKMGKDVINILIEPNPKILTIFEQLALSVTSRSEGFFLPLYGGSGIGKTTLTSNLTFFLPSFYENSIVYSGNIDYDLLSTEINKFSKNNKADSKKVIPIIIDHRENNPPDAKELSIIKRFVRKPSLGSKCLIIWLETNIDICNDLSNRYQEITGKSPINIPLHAEGPNKDLWQKIAKSTIEQVNSISNIEEFGIDPATYNPDHFPTIGAYLRNISNDFNNLLIQLKNESKTPISLNIVFVSSSVSSGILSHLTSQTRYGLVDATALLRATPDSESGKFWKNKTNLLVQSIYKLNVHAFALPPTPTVSILSMFGSDDLKKEFNRLGINSAGKSKLKRDISRSDFGKFLVGDDLSYNENRGTPAETSVTAFNLLSERGFTFGKDKKLNQSMCEGLALYYNECNIMIDDSKYEKALPFCSLIPDNSFYSNDLIITVEYTWRKGDFVVSANRSTIAQYILEKIKNYAVALEWISL